MSMRKYLSKVKEYAKYLSESLGEFLIFISVTVGITLTENSIKKTGSANFVLIVFICYLIIFIGLCMIKVVSKRKNKSIPVPMRRFTRYENGYIEIKESDLDDAIIYLHNLEEYLRKEGVRNVK